MEENIKVIIYSFQIAGLQAASITFFSSYCLRPHSLSLAPSYLLSLSPAEKIKAVGGLCLFYILLDNGRWCILIRAQPTQSRKWDNGGKGTRRRTNVTGLDMWKHTARRV